MVTGRRSSALVAAVVLLVGGCSSDDPEELSLEDSSEAAAPEEGDDADAADGEPAEDAADAEQESPGDAEEQLYPPLPPLEPNPDSDVPVEDQEFFLELHGRVYEHVETALATNDFDREKLEEYLAPREADALVASIEARRQAGTELRSPDAHVEWVEVTDAASGEAIVQDCRVAGPMTGSYDSESGEQLERTEGSARIVETRYAAIDVDGDIDYRAIEVRAGEDRSRCDA